MNYNFNFGMSAREHLFRPSVQYAVDEVKEKDKHIGYVLVGENISYNSVSNSEIKEGIKSGKLVVPNLQIDSSGRLLKKPLHFTNENLRKFNGKFTMPMYFGVTITKIKEKPYKNNLVYMGVVFLHGKKLGKWIGSSNLEVAEFDFDKNILAKSTQRCIDAGVPCKNIEHFLINVIKHTEDFAYYLQILKGKYNSKTVISITDIRNTHTEHVSSQYSNISDIKMYEENNIMEKIVRDTVYTGYMPKINVYTDINDFVIE